MRLLTLGLCALSLAACTAPLNRGQTVTPIVNNLQTLSNIPNSVTQQGDTALQLYKKALTLGADPAVTQQRLNSPGIQNLLKQHEMIPSSSVLSQAKDQSTLSSNIEQTILQSLLGRLNP